jgi:hypothetical protein
MRGLAGGCRTERSRLLCVPTCQSVYNLLLRFVVQPWEGDITLVLPSHMWNVGKSIVNPTNTEIINATRQVRFTALPCSSSVIQPPFDCAMSLMPCLFLFVGNTGA